MLSDSGSGSCRGCAFLRAAVKRMRVSTPIRKEEREKKRTPTSPRRLLFRGCLFPFDPFLKRVVFLTLTSMFIQNLTHTHPSRVRIAYDTQPTRRLTDSNSFSSVSGLFADLFDRALVSISAKCANTSASCSLSL